MTSRFRQWRDQHLRAQHLDQSRRNQQTVGEYVAKHAVDDNDSKLLSNHTSKSTEISTETGDANVSRTESIAPLAGDMTPRQVGPSVASEVLHSTEDPTVDEEAPWSPLDSPLMGPQMSGTRFSEEVARVPSAIDFASSRIQLDAGALGAFYIAAASIIGRRHSVEGTTRQDAYAFATSEDDDAAILAVADGLGSQHFSHLGATSICTDICRNLARYPIPVSLEHFSRVVTECLEAAQSRLLSVWASAHGVTEARHLATTLVLAWIPADSGRALLCRIGDSNAFIATDGVDEPFTATFDRADGPINAVAASLPTRTIHTSLEVLEIELKGFSKVVLCTDGFSDDIYESPSVRKWVAERLSSPCGERWMLDTMSYSRKGSHDDRTAVVIWLPKAVADGDSSSQFEEPAQSENRLPETTV